MIIGIVIAILIIYIVVMYNVFINWKNKVNEAFSTMDIYLKKRWDLIPNLVETVKGYSNYEKNVFEKVTDIRANSYANMTVENKIDINQELNIELDRIVMLAENYPNLKASNSFIDLMNQLSKVEDEIANSRKYYNAVVKKYNIKIGMFPNNIIAMIFKFKNAKMFEISEKEKNNIKVEI